MAPPVRGDISGSLAFVVAISVSFLPRLGLAQVPTALDELEPPPAVEGRLIVRYAPSVSRSVQGILAESGRFEEDTGSASLDKLNAELGVRAAQPLVMKRGNLRGARATARYFDRHAQVRARYPQRAARAPAEARAPDLSNVYIVDIDPKLDVHEAARRYATDSAVVYATPDYILHADFVPNDPFFSSTGTWSQSYEDLWGLHIADAATAWDVADGAGTVVAIVDTGIDLRHPDLAANIWTNPGEIPDNGVDDDANGFIDDVVGWDFEEDDNDPSDRNGHGTHVAGTVAAVGNNGLGVIGMSWGAQVMALRGLGADGSGYSSDLAAAIIYAAENGADVINNSYGGFVGPWPNDPISDAIATARALGVVVVASAGNNGFNLRLGGFPASAYSPAGVEGTITVGASTSDDSIASFSTYGRGVSVSAPGVDILSLKGKKSGNVGGQTVAGDYLRLSGTSMSGPHVAGLAALLLSGLPSLNVDEVQWRIELSADQPGYPGWEGEAWNPWHGWGRVNAGRVFDTLPVTTRLETELAPKHAFPAETLSLSSDVLDLTITTSAATPWTAGHPSWIQPSQSTGTAGGRLAFSYDSTGLAPGSYTGAVAINVPGAVDGGASTEANLYVHRDERVGPEMVLRQDSSITGWFGVPAVISNGLGTLVVWSEPEPASSFARIMAVRFDAAGTPSAPFPLHEGSFRPSYPRLATDGHGYVVVWTEVICKASCFSKRRDNGIMMMRLDSQGRPTNPSPVVIDQSSERSGLGVIDIDFDGTAYTLLLAKAATTGWTYYARRLGRDGALWNKKRRIGRYPRSARFACATGTCLMSWSSYDSAVTTPGGFFVYSVESLEIVEDRVVDANPTKGATSFFFPSALVSNGTSYLLTGSQHLLCGEGNAETICRRDVVTARMAPDGTTMDPQGVPLNFNSPLYTFDTQPFRGMGPGRTVFDGTSYLLPFLTMSYGWSEAPKNIFLARLRPDGSLMDAEDEGLLVRSQQTNIVGTPQVAADALHSIVVFGERNWNPWQQTIYAVPVLARSADPSFIPATIGTVGTLNIAEGETLERAFSGAGLNPDTTTFTMTGLPSGAHLDTTTGLFSWRPDGAQVGTYAVQLQADDGNGRITEDITVNVFEASLSVSGTVRLTADRSPAAGISLELRGYPERRLLTYTDAQGRFHFDDLIPNRRYKLRMTRPSSKVFRAKPRSIRITPSNADAAGLDVYLTLK